jgi:hypothetical protein
MDCDKVESAIIDELYGELDEVTSAAVRRHIAGCSRCTTLLSGLRTTRRLAALQLVEPPPNLERRILRAAGADQGVAPAGRHLSRVVSVAGSWAMRPQSAMAAVFLVMLGASVLLLRGRSSRAPASSEMIVTEKGTPAPAAVPIPAPQGQAGELAPTPALAAEPFARATAPRVVNPPQAGGGAALDFGAVAARERPMAKIAASPRTEEAVDALKTEPASNFAAAPAARAAGRPAKNADDEGTAAELSTGSASSNGLAAAVALRDSQGCRAAVARFDEVAQHAAGSAAGWEALLQSARCYRSLGDVANARARLTTLLGVTQFKDRARSDLDLLDRASAIPPQP